MAAQVLSGSGNLSYTNSTAQNVRLVINWLETGEEGGTMTFQGVTLPLGSESQYGKALAFRDHYGNTTDAYQASMAAGNRPGFTAVPLEIALSNGETFSITRQNASHPIKGYNIIIIPEAG